MIINLSPRLSAAASLIKGGGIVADIGTDHGYLPVYLIQSGKIERAIALSTNINDLIAINETVLTTIQAINNLEDALREKAIAVLDQLNCIR